ncbi:MAG TPA: hypothetical protein VED59_00030 [Acidimicrobiales bacterium]|nr:hypothetical protein [Acidimicrobiales bacterium]
MAKITADWLAFFSGSTPASRRIELVQDGASFAAIVKAQAGTPLAKGVAAKVSKVTLKSATDAQVKYSVTMGGTTVLADQLGEAVLENGTWKVSVSSFCALLALEQAKVPACSASPGTTS